MEYEVLKKEIRSLQFKNIYLLHGEEPYFIDELTTLIENNALLEAEKAFNQTIFYGKDTSPLQLLETLRRAPMMAERQLVVLREAQDFKGWEELTSYAAKPSHSSIFVIAYKYKKFDARTSFYKALPKTTVDCFLKKLYDDKVPTWIATYLKNKGYGISAGAAMLTANHLGNDLSNITNELEKLLIILPKDTMIDRHHIEKYIGISKEFNIFELQKALVSKDGISVARIALHFEANIKRNPLIMTLSTMYGFIMKTALFHEVAGSDNATKAKVLGINPFFIKDYEMAARRWSLPRLIYLFRLLREYDARSKGIGNNHVSEGALCKEFILKMHAT